VSGSGPGIGIARFLLITAAVAAAIASVFVDGGNWAPLQITWPIAGLLLVGAGMLVNRLWAALLPLGFTTLYVAYLIGKNGMEGAAWGEMGFLGVVILLFIIGGAIAVALLFGVAIRKAIEARRRMS